MTLSVTKFWRLAPAERRFLLAAAVALPIIWMRLRWYGLAAVQRWVASYAKPAQVTHDRVDVQHLADLCRVAVRHVPCPTTCLTRSLVLVLLLQKKGLTPKLRIGVRMVGSALDAHAWVEYAGIPVNDAPDVAQRFAVFSEPLPLSAFPTR